MRNKLMNLHIFDEGGDGGDAGSGNQGGSAGTGGSGQRGNAGYTFEQAEEIANNRAEKATRAALADFYRKQGLSEAEITTAIADFKAKQKANQPDIDAITQERDTFKQELQQMKNEKVLSAKGVRSEDMDYVLFKINQLVDDKTDFAKTADKFLKENPRFGKGAYKVSTSTGSDNQNTGGSVNASINDRIRAAMRR